MAAHHRHSHPPYPDLVAPDSIPVSSPNYLVLDNSGSCEAARIDAATSSCLELFLPSRASVRDTPQPCIDSPLLELLDDEPNRMRSTLDTSTLSEARLEQLEKLAARLGVQVVKVAPGDLLELSVSTFQQVRKILERPQRAKHHVRLVRVASRVASVIAEIMYSQGSGRLAREWWTTSIQAAQEAGDNNLLDLAVASLAYIPTYGGRPDIVLDLVRPRIDQQRPCTPAVAWLWGTAARAHALAGDTHLFEKAIAQSHNVLIQSDPTQIGPGIFSFTPHKHAFYNADGYTSLGRSKDAIEAANHALAMYDPADTTEPALVRLDCAIVLAQQGDLDGACEHAIAAISAPNTFLSVTVRSWANRFDSHLDPDDPAAANWRERYHAALHA